MIVFHILNPESWILYPSITGKPFDRLRTGGLTGKPANGPTG
ncbi:hypothetical protein D3OALGA1CA_5614 [Olavius algarvensis associated proteobacterium Delta 3]|nr:hypothetical protein D3OALGB2SA_38 [Olavius algarvensis associated proteobacterium Delta 3]CAB5169170.1 hypothetical protein D3OALGA1CA_5614 [Olavius algarvensis associated proteobacterium Delta 3]